MQSSPINTILANASERPEAWHQPGSAGSQELSGVVLTPAGFNSCQVVEQLLPSLSLKRAGGKSEAPR